MLILARGKSAMKCPICHFDNPDSQRFCGECKTQLLFSENASVSQTEDINQNVNQSSKEY